LKTRRVPTGSLFAVWRKQEIYGSFLLLTKNSDKRRRTYAAKYGESQTGWYQVAAQKTSAGKENFIDIKTAQKPRHL
jgi:hypothetical protein